MFGVCVCWVGVRSGSWGSICGWFAFDFGNGGGVVGCVWDGNDQVWDGV